MTQHPETANAADFFASRGAVRRIGPQRPVRYENVPCMAAHDVLSPSIFSRCMYCHGTGVVSRRVS